MKEPPPGCPIEVWEKYLRGKWEASDLFPEGFDPEKLEKKLQAQLPSRSKSRTPEVNKALPKVVREERKPSLADDVKGKDGKVTADLLDSQEGPYRVPFPEFPGGNGVEEAAFQAAASVDVDETRKLHEDGPGPAEGPMGGSFYQRLRANAIEAGVLAPDDAVGPEIADVERRPTPRIRTGSKPPLSKSAYANSCPDPDCDSGAAQPITRAKAPNYFPYNSRMRKGK